MNKSGLSHPNASLLSLNSSICEPCCSHQEQYSQLYKEMSQLRTEHRVIKQETSVLRNTNKGLEEQIKMLKQFLKGKKDLVQELNLQLTQAQQEIDRLEQKCVNEEEKRKAKEEELREEKKEWKVEREEWRKQREQNKRQKDNLDKQRQELIIKMEQLRKETLQSEKYKSEDLMHRIQQISRQLETQKYNKVKEMKILTEFMTSSSVQLKNDMKNLPQSLQLAIEQTQKKNLLLAEKNQEVQSLRQEIAALKENKDQLLQKVEKQNKAQQWKQFWCLLLKQMEIIMKNLLKESYSLFQKISQLCIDANVPPSMQVGVLMKELSDLSVRRKGEWLKYELSVQKSEQLCLRVSSLEEERDLISLKYNTLYREYQNVVGDNNRLIKYREMSDYRTRRNLKSIDPNRGAEKPEQQKENYQYLMNV